MPYASRNNLLKHQAVLKRTLSDFKAGRNADHLTSADLKLLINGLKARLVDVRGALAALNNAREGVHLQTLNTAQPCGLQVGNQVQRSNPHA